MQYIHPTLWKSSSPWVLYLLVINASASLFCVKPLKASEIRKRQRSRAFTCQGCWENIHSHSRWSSAFAKINSHQRKGKCPVSETLPCRSTCPCLLKSKISLPLNRTVTSPAYSPGRSPSQHHCTCWGGCTLRVQGLQRRPTSHPVAETHHSERQSLRPRRTPLRPSVKGRFLHFLF